MMTEEQIFSRFSEAVELRSAARTLALRQREVIPSLTPEQLAMRQHIIGVAIQLLNQLSTDALELGIHEYQHSKSGG